MAPLLALALAAGGCAESDAGACGVCMREKCSDLIALCAGAFGCTCMVECTGNGGIPAVQACLGSCGLTERPEGFVPIEECTAVACPDTGDECATPSDWTRPGDEVTCDGAGTGGIGGGALADCGFDPGLRFDPNGTVLQLESADHRVCARVERRDDGSGSLANTSWTPLELRVGPLGEVARVAGATDLCWYSSHHNFRDWLHAWSGTRHFDLRLEEDGHGGERAYDLYVFEEGAIDPSSCAPTADGVRCIDGPIALFPVNP